ncbi:hypothetical protein ASPZODRAFT_136129 [Penicilliopsis zonata CBS 506.65]|uniref:Alpha-L-rhamnosidase C-terminal domain-containing protein n=1 Tax=Penicilliopsis zonata CBS 506.65 TaxID=1073090 RepID=A0A1L9S945_9EURO|nr:hypothetical protein ASPZODRAFT_136129 [Penicilliopsis zonata CBS 506.65]OJJ43674.1 hypothetical protein ASPZODRAFT_136129 [Penicilliopsis zonata CBS 506.65]
MNSYRHETHRFETSTLPGRVESYFAQKAQRYQKLVLKTPHSTLNISSIGFTHTRVPHSSQCSFKCSNELLNQIWLDGVRTVDMCTVDAGEVSDAWEVIDRGTRIRGQHWAPCRHGTGWGDKTVKFEVLIENGGASWGVHMNANGLIFCLDVATRSLKAVEGFSDTGGIFPPQQRGLWPIETSVDLTGWLRIQTVTRGFDVTVTINDHDIATLADLKIRSMKGGAPNNTGSVTFGGPENYTAIYRFLQVTDAEDLVLYQNNLLPQDKHRTLADFAVGTNNLACTVDGAKRDGALFAGDLFVIGRSIFYSTGTLEAVLGSIRLLTSHQVKDGYLGNLCPIQAPTSEDIEAPSYAFYSLSYALLLIVAVKDYWLHSGDSSLIQSIWEKLDKMIEFTESHVDDRGLVVAPTPLLMDWFPRNGPIFGASGKVNLAYYDALKCMSRMCDSAGVTDRYASRAEVLKDCIIAHLWNEEAHIMKMSDKFSPTGLCQDIQAYSITTGVSPSPAAAAQALIPGPDEPLPLPYKEIQGWTDKGVVSPYATGFAVEALFEKNRGSSAVELVERLWGVMADKSSANYSGGHWEALKADGTPFSAHTSLVHGWSTWPVYLLPRYLGGIEPLEPGWSRYRVRPVLAGLEDVEVEVSTPAGMARVELHVREPTGTGRMTLTVPRGAVAEVSPPLGWIFEREAPADSENNTVIVLDQTSKSQFDIRRLV